MIKVLVYLLFIVVFAPAEASDGIAPYRTCDKGKAVLVHNASRVGEIHLPANYWWVHSEVVQSCWRNLKNGNFAGVAFEPTSSVNLEPITLTHHIEQVDKSLTKVKNGIVTQVIPLRPSSNLKAEVLNGSRYFSNATNEYSCLDRYGPDCLPLLKGNVRWGRLQVKHRPLHTYADPRLKPDTKLLGSDLIGFSGGIYGVYGRSNLFFANLLTDFDGVISGSNSISSLIDRGFDPDKTYSSYPQSAKGRSSHYKGPYRHVALGAQIFLGAMIFAFGLLYQDHAFRMADTLKVGTSGVYAGAGTFLILAAFIIIGHGIWAFTT